MTLEQRVKELRDRLPKVEEKIAAACEGAAMRAVEKATELTPPTGDDLKGTNTRTGELKAHWAADSQTRPQNQNGRYVSLLANSMDYASYVNDGHRMDRHFVPGLYINPASGLLEYNPDRKSGMVVGTKTTYVPGIFMVEAAKEEYRRVLRFELAGLEEMLK